MTGSKIGEKQTTSLLVSLEAVVAESVCGPETLGRGVTGTSALGLRLMTPQSRNGRVEVRGRIRVWDDEDTRSEYMRCL